MQFENTHPMSALQFCVSYVASSNFFFLLLHRMRARQILWHAFEYALHSLCGLLRWAFELCVNRLLARRNEEVSTHGFAIELGLAVLQAAIDTTFMIGFVCTSVMAIFALSTEELSVSVRRRWLRSELSSVTASFGMCRDVRSVMLQYVE